MDAIDLKFSCVVNESVIPSVKTAYHNVTLGNEECSIARLKSGEKATLPLNRFLLLGQNSSVADLTWKVSYKIRVLSFIGNMRFDQRFASVTNYSGLVQWNAQPSN
jgi:hypothetical protein